MARELDARALRIAVNASCHTINGRAVNRCEESKIIDAITAYLDSVDASPSETTGGEVVEWRVGEEDDEIVYDDFHMERMSDQHIWFIVGGMAFDLGVKGRSKLYWSVQDSRGWDGIAPTFAESAAIDSAPPAGDGVPRVTSGEGQCERCSQPNPLSWFVASDLWNRVMRGGDRGAKDRFGFCCPTCFIELAREAGIDPPAWELRLPANEAVEDTAIVDWCDTVGRRVVQMGEGMPPVWKIGNQLISGTSFREAVNAARTDSHPTPTDQ